MVTCTSEPPEFRDSEKSTNADLSSREFLSLPHEMSNRFDLLLKKSILIKFNNIFINLSKVCKPQIRDQKCKKKIST